MIESRASAVAPASSTVGEHLGLVWSGGVAVLDQTVGAEAAAALWRRADEWADVGDFVTVLGEVTGRPLRDLPPFAVSLLSVDRTTAVLAARGSFVASARGEVDSSVSGTGVTTWGERSVADAVWVAVRAAAAAPGPDEVLPVVAGVVRSRRVAQHVTGPAGAPGAGEAAGPEEVTTIVRPLPPPAPPSGDADELPAHGSAPDVAAPEARDARGARDAPDAGGSDAGGSSTNPRAADSAREAPGPGVVVPALVCPDGHANPPSYETCRACGAALQGDPRPVGRPRLGRLEVSTGATVDLRSAVVVGRAPRARPAESAVLVTIPEPHVSATHLEILLEGWDVVVRDLQSTNGTYLCRPGHPAVRLGPELVTVAHGDVLDLGHGARLTFHDVP